MSWKHRGWIIYIKVIRTFDNRMLGTLYWIIGMRNNGFIEVIKQVSASQTGPCFFSSTRLIYHKCHVLLRYSGAERIFPYALLDILAILRTFMFIWFRYKHCCKVNYSAEISYFYSYFFIHIGKYIEWKL